MRRFICAAVAALAVVGVVAGTASADTPVTISVVPCVSQGGGSMTVPAGSTITFRFGWGASNRGLDQAFLPDEATSASLDGVPVANPESYWGTPQADGPQRNGDWVVNWFYPTGVTLGAGDSVRLTMDITLAHPLTDGYTRSPAGSVFGPATCTVTGE